MDKGTWQATRLAGVLASAMLLAGCAVPIPLQVVSWAADGVSFLTTDKSLADHGISALAQKDCALWRGFKGEDICTTDETGSNTTTIAALAPVSPDSGSPSLDVEKVPDAPGSVSAPAHIKERVLISGLHVWSTRNDADLYYVIGSFRNRDNARRLVQNNPALGPAVMALRLNDEEIYRVAVGPFSMDDKASVRRAIGDSGFKEAWQVQIDRRQWLLATAVKPSSDS
ncbi:MAG: SPOR domain-containing protein [Rhodospirillaceae bacterium]|nr:SPOR domain-containing protein [Rhodospirillaceae bacterium]